jgi:hypothetical protein
MMNVLLPVQVEKDDIQKPSSYIITPEVEQGR